MTGWRAFRFDASGFRWMIGSGAWVEGSPMMAIVAVFPTADVAALMSDLFIRKSPLKAGETVGWAYFDD